MYALYMCNPLWVIMYVDLLCGLKNKFNHCNPTAQKFFRLVLVISQQLYTGFAQGRYQQVLRVAQPVALAPNLQMRLHCAKAMVLVSSAGEMMVSIHLYTHVRVNTVGGCRV